MPGKPYRMTTVFPFRKVWDLENARKSLVKIFLRFSETWSRRVRFLSCHRGIPRIHCERYRILERLAVYVEMKDLRLVGLL